MRSFTNECEALFESQRFDPPSVRSCDDGRVEAMLRDMSRHVKYAVEQFWRHVSEGRRGRPNQWDKLSEEMFIKHAATMITGELTPAACRMV